MKKIENNFAVTGFGGKDAEIRQFTNASVARFPLAVSRLENNGEESKRVSAFMNFEAWRKNENTGSFDQLTKGTMLTVEGYFKPEEWSDQSGVKHNRIVMVAVKFYPPVEKEETPEKPAKPAKKRQEIILALSRQKRPLGRFCFTHYGVVAPSVLLYSTCSLLPHSEMLWQV